jgi:ribonuclease D
LLAATGIRFADDSGFLNARELVEDFLDFPRVDVDAVDQEHVLFAVGDEIIAFSIAVADVASEQPAIAHDFGGFLWLLPVAQHDVAAADAEFADFTGANLFAGVVLDADFDVGNGQADGAGFAGAVEGVFGDDGAGLTQTVTLDERDVELGLELLEHLGWQRGGPADADAQGQGDVAGGVDHAAVELGDGGEDGCLALEHFLEHVADGVDGFDEDDGPADEQRQEQADRQHVAMEQRQQDAEAVGGDGAQDNAAAFDVVEEVLMGKHGTFGAAGCAGGVDDDREVGCLRLEGFPRSAAGGIGLDRFHVDQLQTGPHGLERAVMGAEFGVGDEDVYASIVEDEVHLVGFEEIVHRHGDGAGVEDAEQGRDELGTILEPKAYAVPRADAESLPELPGDEERLLPQGGVGVFPLTPEEGDFLGLLPHGFGEGAGQVHAGGMLAGRTAAGQDIRQFKNGPLAWPKYIGAVIDTEQGLSAYLPVLRAATWVALDTEADSLHAYPEKLCLIQISTVAGDRLIDTLAGMNLDPLLEALSGHELIMHGADYDLRLLRRHHEFVPGAIFDTMLAARLLGVPQFGLGHLVERYLKVKLEKGPQKANWALRPLTARMELYARNDTRFLKPLSDRLKSELEARGRLTWQQESCARLIADSTRHQPADLDTVWRIKGSHLLGRPGLAILRELWQWREAEAIAANKPPFFVMSHQAMVDIAAAAAAAQPIDGLLPKHISDRRRSSLIKAIEHGRALAAERHPKPLRKVSRRPSEGEKRRFTDLQKQRDLRAAELGIDPTVIASRAMLSDLAHDWEKHRSELMNWQLALLKD